MQFLTFIIPTIIQLYIIILLLRVLMQYVKADFYNPFSQFVIKVTQPIIEPFRCLIPTVGNIDIISLLVAYMLTIINIFFVILITKKITLISLTLLPISFIQLLSYLGKLFFLLLLIRSILNWITKWHNPIDYAIIRLLTEPIISLINRIIPSVNGLDFSAIIAMLILIALNYLRLNILIFIDPSISTILYSAGYLM
ncbi:MAG: YggT family protein [Arsenophonus sp. ER-BJ3-MAG3]